MIGRRVSFWLLAWLAGAAIWMVLTDSVRLVELIAGAAVAALAATGFDLARAEKLADQAFKPGLTLRVWRVLPRIVPDVARLTRAAFAQLVERKPARGRVITMEIGHAGHDPERRAYRALASGFGSMAPNTVVIGVEPDAGVIYVHQLEPTRRPGDLDPLGLR